MTSPRLYTVTLRWDVSCTMQVAARSIEDAEREAFEEWRELAHPYSDPAYNGRPVEFVGTDWGNQVPTWPPANITAEEAHHA